MDQTIDKKHILIIEDDDFLRSLAVTKLEAEGFDVDIAADGEQGMEKLAERLPHLILLDLMLPQIDGFQILQSLQDSGQINETKVLVFSNLGSTEDIKRATSLGAHEYVIKSSFTLAELVEKVRSMTT